MKARRWWFLLPLTAVVVVVLRHGWGALVGRRAAGGIVIGDTGIYELFSRVAMGSLLDRIGGDVASVVPRGARVLEVGCGPGHLAIRLAREHGLKVTGLDLDPAMIARARGHAERSDRGTWTTFVVGDVASLPFPSGSFDVAVTTLSMHHWADATAGLREIDRVLRPGAPALIWDFRCGLGPLHAHLPDPIERVQGSPMRLASAMPWRWPWTLEILMRIELRRA